MKFLSTLFITTAAAAFLWLAAVAIQLGNPTQQTEWLDGIYKIKEAAALRLNEPKILIISGSNSLFGLDSSLLSARWAHPVVNGGVHAGLGASYILHRSKQSLRADDIVILALEYSMFQADGEPSDLLLDFMMSRDNEYFFSQSVSTQIKSAFSISWKRLAKGWLPFFGKSTVPTHGIYSTQNLDELGNQTGTELEQISTEMVTGLAARKPFQLANSTLSISFIEQMNSYLAWAKENNVCVLFLPPARLKFDEYQQPRHIEFFAAIRQYFENNGVPVAGTFLDHHYPLNWFFDTDYHLNAEGRMQRTEQVLQEMPSPLQFCSSGG